MALVLLAALALTPAALAKGDPAKTAAKAELQAYKRDHQWVRSVSLGTCDRRERRLVCAGRIKGRKGGAAVTCALRVVVEKRSLRAKTRIGKCQRPASKEPSSAPVGLSVHLDPAPKRDLFDPFKVTYAYAASASREGDGAPAPLPPGVLSLYSDGRLECAVNVGGATTGGECPVRYEKLGQHRVTSIYTSGEKSATVTKLETIEPLPTTTSLDLSYSDLPGGPEALPVGPRCNYVENKCWFFCSYVNNGAAERCYFKQEWRLGTLTVKASSFPAGRVSLQCSAGGCPIGDSGSLNGELEVDISMFASGDGLRPPAGYNTPPTCEFMKTNAEAWQADFSGVGITARPTAAGYVGAPVSKALEFTPVLPC